MRARTTNVAIAISVAMSMASAAAQTPPQTTPSTQTTTTASRFPAGPGRDALFKVCRECHGPESVLGQLKTREEWSKTLDEMASNGASGTDEEWKEILDYLATHYSLIFVNKATATELESTLDVSAAIAEAIVSARTEQGALKTIDELKRVPGVDQLKIDARKDRFVF